jgi:hypothetical protein
MNLNDVFDELHSRAERVPRPLRLPTVDEVIAAERQIGLPFPADYRRFLLEASDVVLGTLEPATICDPTSHTHFPDVVASARAFGVPDDWIPICEDNADFYCLDPAGAVRFWSHNGATHDSWPNIATWLRDVWLGERA